MVINEDMNTCANPACNIYIYKDKIFCSDLCKKVFFGEIDI